VVFFTIKRINWSVKGGDARRLECGSGAGKVFVKREKSRVGTKGGSLRGDHHKLPWGITNQWKCVKPWTHGWEKKRGTRKEKRADWGGGIHFSIANVLGGENGHASVSHFCKSPSTTFEAREQKFNNRTPQNNTSTDERSSTGEEWRNTEGERKVPDRM